MRAVLLLAVLVATSPNAIAQAPEPKYEGKPLAYWIDRFQKAENEKDRIEAVKAVCAFGPDAAPAVPQLLVMLDDRSASYRDSVADMLCAIGPAAKGAVPEFIKLLEAELPRDPNQVIRILCSIGGDAKDSIPAVRQAVLNYIAARRMKKEVGYHIWVQTMEFHRLGADILPLLLELLSTEDFWFVALQELPKLGPAAKAALPTLRKVSATGFVTWYFVGSRIRHPQSPRDYFIGDVYPTQRINAEFATKVELLIHIGKAAQEVIDKIEASKEGSDRK